jgi:hypothetical protein
MLVHNVFFTLNENTDSSRQALVEACRTYLPSHEGVVFFACGTRQAGLERPVNDRDFDVALHMVFRDKAAHDAYQEAPQHLEFVEENRAGWAKVRVFDSEVETTISRR